MGLMMLKLFDDSEERKAMRVLALALAVLNQYQGGMCISEALTRTERTLRYLISPLGPTGRHRQCGLAICTFHLGFSLGMALLLFGAIIMALGYSSSNERAVWVGWCVFLSAGVPSVLVHRWFRT